MSSSEGSYTPFGSQSSLEGSYTPFQSPNSSLANLEFEFTEFESTSGISGLPFIDQLDDQIATMSQDGVTPISPRQPITEEPEEIEPSEGWNKFYKYAVYMLQAINTEVKLLENHLQNPSINQSVAQISTHVFKTNRFRTKLATLEDDLKEAMYAETFPHNQLANIQKDIASAHFDVDTQHAVIDDLLEKAREKVKEKDALTAALRQVANTPTVEIPKFNGKTINYNSFKTNFKFVIETINGPPELRATHLINSLDESVKQYLGDENEWFNKYDELWEMLDSKYANDWTVNNETVSAFFHYVLSSEEPEQVQNMFYKQLDNIKKILSLGLSVEEILVGHLIDSLPIAYKTRLKDALRMMLPNRDKACFSSAEVRKVFNDTIAVIHDEATLQSKHPPTFLSHYNQATEEDSEDEYEDETTQNQAQLLHSIPQQHPHYQGNISGHQKNYQQPNAMTSQHQVSTYNQPMPNCSLCQGQDFPHPTHHCHLFPTPYEKGAQLIQLGRCPSCTREQHPQSPCPYYLSCAFHPGERHYTWLCQGQAATGPL